MSKLENAFHALTSNRWFFFLLPFWYFILFGRFGLDETDGGILIAPAYRITHGALPYRDFIWVRPPLSLYLHAIILSILPSNLAFISERLFFYLLVAAYCLLATLTIERYFPLERFRMGRYQFATICFLFSAHAFPPMPWVTVDGIAFAALGIYLIAGRDSLFSSAIGMVALVLGALTKQSFYPMPLVGLALAFFLRRKHLVACLGGTALAVGGFFSLLEMKGVLKLFLIQSSGDTTVRAVLNQAALPYLGASLGMVFLACLMALLDLRVFKCAMTSGSVVSKTVFYFVLLSVTNIYLHYVLHRGEQGQLDYARVTFLAGLVLLVALLTADTFQPAMVFAALLALAWCTSVSFGYPTPVLFSVPLVLTLIGLANRPGCVSPAPLYVALLLGGALLSFAGYQYPYRDAPRAELTQDMGQVFPKLSFVRTSPGKIAMYRELKELHLKYGDNFQTLPDFTFAHFLTNTNSPIQNDWPMNIEIGHHPQPILDRLTRLDTHVFVQKRALPIAPDGLCGSDVTDRILHTWRKVDETEFFLVYVKP